MKLFGCKACEVLEEQVEHLRNKPCVSCENWKAQIKYLQDQIRLQREDWKNEREEYKRTVDRLMEKSGTPGVGQGSLPDPLPPGKVPSIDEMQGLFDEVPIKRSDDAGSL